MEATATSDAAASTNEKKKSKEAKKRYSIVSGSEFCKSLF